MQITLNITEDSKVELVRNCETELVQGECCFTEFVFNFPATIKGYAISEYAKYIEFGECKDLGECVKFIDEIKGNTYELHEACTAFKKVMVQIVFTRNTGDKKITWKTLPFTLEFVESINANGTTAIQTQLLWLTEIRDEWQTDFENTKAEWEAFVKASCLRMIYSVSNLPTADADSNGDTIFYLGENTGELIYGHYYRCNNVNGVYSWYDLTQDPSLEGVANGIREINKNRTIQLWAGTKDELENVIPQENVGYIAEDMEVDEFIAGEIESLRENQNEVLSNFHISKGWYEVPSDASLTCGNTYHFRGVRDDFGIITLVSGVTTYSPIVADDTFFYQLRFTPETTNGFCKLKVYKKEIEGGDWVEDAYFVVESQVVCKEIE